MFFVRKSVVCEIDGHFSFQIGSWGYKGFPIFAWLISSGWAAVQRTWTRQAPELQHIASDPDSSAICRGVPPPKRSP